MSQSVDARKLRVRDDALADALGVTPYVADPGAPCLVAQTTTLKAYPTAAQGFFACSPVAVLGAEVEGGPATLTAASSTLLALNLGSALPPQGTSVILTFVGNRWVFRYDA